MCTIVVAVFSNMSMSTSYMLRHFTMFVNRMSVHNSAVHIDTCIQISKQKQDLAYIGKSKVIRKHVTTVQNIPSQTLPLFYVWIPQSVWSQSTAWPSNKTTIISDLTTTQMSRCHVSCFLSLHLIVFQYEELMHYSGLEAMSVGEYRDDIRALPPSQYGSTIPDLLKQHKNQIYG